MSRPLPVTIAAAVERELEVRRSRFIARIEPVGSVSDAEEAIAAARRRHADANHHCTAMLTGVHADQARSSDDGEPSGTAGMDWAATTGAVVGDTRYDAQATLEVWVPADNLIAARAELATWSSGTITPALGPERVVDVRD